MEPDLLALIVGMRGSIHCRCLVRRPSKTNTRLFSCTGGRCSARLLPRDVCDATTTFAASIDVDGGGGKFGSNYWCSKMESLMWASMEESVKRRRWWHPRLIRRSTSLIFSSVSSLKQAFQELLPKISLLKSCFLIKPTGAM
ncbi:hypothetical protein SADUNF_Sadunf07G0041300 [Salix dunnii]|uniref:Uncharacterized protein n=1 Tax=Salix dunnii TaxID=1413687 RepID=A0A835MVM6_9ROSI|nr:hypothetical protein SADUNF_Sadunf07G0041300 [Salix dunnii]